MQVRQENRLNDERKDSGSDSEGLDKSDSGNEETIMSPNYNSPSYNYSNAMSRDEEKELHAKYLLAARESEKLVGGRLTSQKAASPLVIQWLQENYEAADGTSLPRSTLYTHYLGFCSSMSLEPVNAASFGKLIRSIFPNLKTRRLGTRGHSKYHYYGIQIKQSSDLRLPAFSSEGISANKMKSRLKKETYEAPEKIATPSMPYEEPPAVITGANSISLPEFQLANVSIPPNVSMDHVQSFIAHYRKHCQSLVDYAFKHEFGEIEKILRHFWQTLPTQYRTVAVLPEVLDLISKKDQLTYKAIAHVLLPNVLQALPVSIPQNIRQFSKQFEPWLITSLEGLPPQLGVRKLMVAKLFAQTLHKLASLNHLTQAARAVLQNPSQVNQMIIDWNRLDFECIKTQASWVCQCGDDIFTAAQEEFKKFLIERASLEQWAAWLQELVNRILGKCTDQRELTSTSQQLLLKWSFYSTLIIRDLTIRNATSFGSFHLLRTLFDEYIVYLVDTRQAPNEVLIMNQPTETTHTDPFSLELLLNKDTTQAARGPMFPKATLPYPFPEREEEYREEYLPLAGVPRMPGLSFRSDDMQRMVGLGLKRPTDPLPPPVGNYTVPDHLRAQFSRYERPDPEQNKKMRLSDNGSQMAEVN